MEIMSQSNISIISIWGWIAICSGLFGGTILLVSMSVKSGIGVIIGLTLSIISLCLFIFAPLNNLTDQAKYIVEITDQSKYKELIDAGYTFQRLYENYNIYEIVGGVLK